MEAEPLDDKSLDAWILRAAPYSIIARAELGLTIYTADPLAWAQTHAAVALETFLRRVSSARLGWYTTSLLGTWKEVDARSLGTLVTALSSWSWLHGRGRHGFRFELADDPEVPSLGFSYVEIDPTRRRRAGVLEITLPRHTRPSVLEEMALELTADAPYWSGVGGFAIRWNPEHLGLAFTIAHNWCRRYRGLDVSDPDLMSWHALDALPATGWLTLVGAPLAHARGLGAESLAAHPWQRDIAVLPTRAGFVVRAGAEPSLCDVNRFAMGEAYGEVARHLAPHLVAEPPALWGAFSDGESTLPYLQRFVNVDGWG